MQEIRAVIKPVQKITAEIKTGGSAPVTVSGGYQLNTTTTQELSVEIEGSE